MEIGGGAYSSPGAPDRRAEYLRAFKGDLMIKRAIVATMLGLVFGACSCGDDDDDMIDSGMEDAPPTVDRSDTRPDRMTDATPDVDPLENVAQPCMGTCRGSLRCQGERRIAIGGAADPIDDFDGGITAIYFKGGYCTPAPLAQFGRDPEACDPNDEESCGAAGIACLALTPDNGTMCLLECEPAQETNPCPGEGQNCDVSSHVCQPFGCSSDDECRIFRMDTNGNGRIDPYNAMENPMGDHLVYDTDSMAVCNPVTYRCDNPGTMGAAAGTLCMKDSQCEENGDCFTEASGFPGGYCTKLGCDIDGRECADPAGEGGAVCQTRGIGVPVCLEDCEVGAEDMADQLGAMGHGDTCREGYTCVWNGTGGEGEINGGCGPGVYNDIMEPNVGTECEAAADCYSRFGAARCLTRGFGDQGSCSLFDCGAPGIPADVCGPDAQCIGFTGTATTICLRNCTMPSDCATATGSNPQGCVEFDGRAETPRVCYPACTGDDDCQSDYRCVAPPGERTGECVRM